MKNKKWKIVIPALLLSLVLGACNGGSKPGPSGSSSDGSSGASQGGDTSILNEVGTYPLVNDPIHMTMFRLMTLLSLWKRRPM